MGTSPNRSRMLTAAAAVAWLLTETAVGCPVCGTDVGRQVRAGLADENVVPNLLAVVLPFALILGVVAVAWAVGGRATDVAARMTPPGTSRSRHGH